VPILGGVLTDCSQRRAAATRASIHSVELEDRHIQALQRFLEADQAWTGKGNDPHTFQLWARGGGKSEINHPGWDETWPAPGKSTIDDLGEANFLRVEPHEATSNNRVFDLTLAGRNALSGEDEPPKNQVGFG
jgi:hypothetical protein